MAIGKGFRGVVALTILALASGCGGSNSGPDLPKDTGPEIAPDIIIIPLDIHEASPDVPDLADPGTGEPDEGGPDEGTAPECTIATVLEDCAAVCGLPDGCHQCVCNILLNGGTCERVTKQDGEECDDGDECTVPDQCLSGVCTPGTQLCECHKDVDCPVLTDKCKGTAYCNDTNFPYTCDVDVSAIPTCPKDQDTFCRANQCAPETGTCKMLPAHQGEPCILKDFCALESRCVDGECTATQVTDCKDENPCTDDSCDPNLGCVRIPNTAPCDDHNACTLDDHCENTFCVSGGAATCDNGVFCDGIETCDPAVGCVSGSAPTCNDGKVCTDDRCDALLDECVNEQRPEAVEGPLGAPNCSDGIDNDCDGKSDAADAKCSFRLLTITPPDGPVTGGTAVVLKGTGLDLVKRVAFGDVEVTTFTATPSTLRVKSPEHPVGTVTVTVYTATGLSASLPDAFTFTGLATDPATVATFLGPMADKTIQQDETTPTYQARVEIPGVTDGPTPDLGAVRAQFGWGFQGTQPWVDPSWRWVDVVDDPTVGGGAFMYSHKWAIDLGGRFNVSARFSRDGGFTWTFADQDGSANGYDPARTPYLVVMGRAKNGDIVLNELAWAGAAEDANDEYIELRNLTQAPISLAGWRITGAGYPAGTDFLFEAVPHVVRNIVIEPFGYFLIAELDASRTVLNVTPDIVAQPTGTGKTMRMPNTGPWTYKLQDANKMTIDTVAFSGYVGQAGDVALKVPAKSMERRVAAADGTKDANWLAAFIREGFRGDPFQAWDFGTPRGPNSDVATCVADDECGGMFPEVTLAPCQKRACGSFNGPPSVGTIKRCTIVSRADGDVCTNGVFCVVDEKCTNGTCGSGKPRDCSDEGPGSLCTADRCDEPTRSCLHDPDPNAKEGPATHVDCSDGIDNDCDGLTDASDPQCLLRIDDVTPTEIPIVGGWQIQVAGQGFDIATGLLFGAQAASFSVDSPSFITASAPVQPAAADVVVQVTDGVVTASWSGRLRCISKADEILANLQWPTDPLGMYVGETTPQIFGRVEIPGYTDAGGDPNALIAEIGLGALGTDPYLEPGWRWLPATWNSQCLGCPAGVYEYGAVLQFDNPGTYLVGFRFSRDGLRWQFGDIGPLSNDWNPDAGLKIRVDPAP